MQPVLPDNPMREHTNILASKDILIPGASQQRNPIIPNIHKHGRKVSQNDAINIAGYDNSIQGNQNSIGLNSGRIDQQL